MLGLTMIDNEQATDFYEIGRTERPARFIQERVEWLGDPGSVRVVPSERGGWDILLRIDGTYFVQSEAQEVCAEFQREVHGLARQVRERGAELHYEPAGPCPVCGSRSIYSRRLDRFLHADGSDNDACWLAILRGAPSDCDRLP